RTTRAMTRRFVDIPGGTFLMGSDGGQEDECPVHRVHIDPFQLSIFPVTRAEYAEFLEDTHHPSPRDWHIPAFSDDDLTVVGVSWLDAAAYCVWRTQLGYPERLPTEAEWERAARGGVEGAQFPCGDEIPAWIPDRGRGPLEAPWQVTLGEPNAF